jgi:protocatechuate 3,4-dioxygenase beta subunit
MLVRNRYLTLGATAVVICLAVLVLRGHAPAARRAPAPALAGSQAGAATPAAAAPVAAAVAVVADDEPAGSLRLEGQVIDGADAPVAGAVVAVDSNPPRRTTSDAAGAFAFDGLLPRAYLIEARAGDRGGGPITVRLSDRTEPVTIRLVAGGRAEVKVVDERSGHAVEAASVELGGHMALTASTDARGIAAFAGVTPGRHAVRVASPDYAPAAADLVLAGASAGLTTVTVVMRRGAAVGGVVVDFGGAPVPGATVSLEEATDLVIAAQPETVTADAGGHWQLAAVARGTFRFIASGNTGTPTTSQPMSFDGSTPRRDIVLHLDAGGRLAGRVVDASGTPAQFALVRVTLPSSALRPRVRETTTDAAGKFTLAHLPRAPLDVVARAAAASSPVTTVELKQDFTDVILTLSNGEAITGVVVTDDGKPIADAQVTAVSTAVLDRRIPDTDITDQDGRFALRGLAAGDYRISAARRSQAWQGLQRDGVEVHT